MEECRCREVLGSDCLFSFLDEGFLHRLRPGIRSGFSHLVELCKGLVDVLTPGGVPGTTSKLSLRVLAQMGRRETEHKGGKQ
jgi:hypothetical protein